MKVFSFILVLVGLSVVHGLTNEQEHEITEIVSVLKSGKSKRPLDELFKKLAQKLELPHSVEKLSGSLNDTKAAYATVYDMLMYIDANAKQTPEQHAKLQELMHIMEAKILKTANVKTITTIVEETEASRTSVIPYSSTRGAGAHEIF
ncbi:hypothetical protein GGI12_003492 [Dipsacomyces acuminosporus]|nr:hypothetical protein GGI12_003492 [Dipsacomyces acuminosporus]